MTKGYKAIILSDNTGAAAAEALRYLLEVRTLYGIHLNPDLTAVDEAWLERVRVVIVVGGEKPQVHRLVEKLEPVEKLLMDVPLIYASHKPHPAPIRCQQVHDLGDNYGLLSKINILARRKRGPKALRERPAETWQEQYAAQVSA